MAKPKSGVKPTTKRRARIAGLGVATLAAAGALLWVLLSEPRGPLIQGKPVAYWMAQLREGPDAIDTLAAEKEVAIPALVRQLSLPDSAAKDFVKGLWRRLPAPLRARVPEPTTRGELRAEAAHALSGILGASLPAGPSLAEAQMMLPVLTKALQDWDISVRGFATIALGYLDADCEQAIEACEVALRDTDKSVRVIAVLSLSQLATGDGCDERAITRLRAALTDSDPQVRKLAAGRLELLE